MSQTVTSRLIAVLPEAMWPEAVRRLRAVPELWALAENDEVLQAMLAWARAREGAEADLASRWRPGPLALAAYPVLHPECAGRADAWLLSAGRERIGAAYTLLTTASTALHPIDEALPAALALRLRLSATGEWSSLAGEAAAEPERWRLPLQYLWGLLTDGHESLFAALAKAGRTGAALAARCLLANLSPEAAVEFVAESSAVLTPRQWLALSEAITAMGEAKCAQLLVRRQAEGAAAAQAKSAPPAWNPLEININAELERALLVAATEDYSLAHPVLTTAWSQIRQLRAGVTAHLGRLALQSGDLVVAQAAFQDAFTERPEDPALRVALADTLVRLNRPQEALALLETAESDAPAAAVVTAEAHLALNEPDKAGAALAELAGGESAADPRLLAKAARLHAELGELEIAGHRMLQAARSTPGNPELCLTAAKWLLDAGETLDALEMATEAAAAAPGSAEVRETLGRALLARDLAAQAIPHFRSALAFEPERHSAAVGLARAALVAGDPALAAEAADNLLAQLPADDEAAAEQQGIAGEAHTLLGQALAAQNQEDEAFDHFRRASSLVPATPEPWRAMARHHAERGDAAQALATLEAGRQALALSASPKASPLLADLAEAYVAAGRNTEAILALREACAADPQAHSYHRRLGILLRRQGTAGEAVDVLQKAMHLRPGDSETLHELGMALEKLGRMNEAWSAYQQATLARPSHPQPYLDLGRMTLALHSQGVETASPLQAVAALRAAIERAPDLAEAYGLLAQAQQSAGDARGALDSYQHALTLAPMRIDWSLGLGQVCLELNRPEIAVAALQEALQHAPDSAEVHAALAAAYARSGLWPEARSTAESGLHLDPENAGLLQLIAEASVQLGQPAEAIQAWRRAVALSPRDARLQVAFGQALLALDQGDEARSVFAQALSLAPDSADVHLAAGRALLTLGEVEQAFEVLSAAVDLAPRSPEVQAAFAAAAAQAGRHEVAHAAFLQAAEFETGRARAAYLREAGEALWALNRPAAAVALWQRALAQGVQDAALRMRLGLAQLQLGQFADALATLEEAVNANPRDAVLAREAGRAALALDELDRAAEHLQTAIEVNPGDAEARFMLGQTRERQGQPEAALQLYRQAARVSPGDGRFLAATANVLALMDRLEDGLRVVESALKIGADDPEVQRRAGELYLRAGRAGEAVHAFEQWVAARPRDAQAHLALARALVVASEARQRSGEADGQAKAANEQDARALSALHSAAALGADRLTVRYWQGRAKAANGDPREAQSFLESITAEQVADHVGGTLSDLYRGVAAALRRAGQFDRAREAVQAALQRDTQPALSNMELGLIEYAAGDPAAAVAAFRRAVAAAPGDSLAHYHLAEALLASGAVPDAVQVMQRALNQRPDSAAWHFRLAQIYRQLRAAGDANASAAALAHFQRACELAPDEALYAAELARALATDGDLAGAAEHYRRATEAQPDNKDLWTERGEIQIRLGDVETAGECFARALRLEPASVPALRGAARVNLAQGKLHDAANKAEAAVRARPDDPEALLCLADVEYARGNSVAAEKCYQSAAARAEKPALALLALGRVYSDQQKWDKAVEILDQATAADPDLDDAHVALGDAHYAAGNFGLAIAAYREAARIAPRHAGHLLKLGRACRAHGQLDQALSHLLQARDLAPRDDEVVREVGLVFEHRKQFDRALEMYKLAIEMAPKSAANYTRAGVALRQLKNYPEAVIALERAVTLDPKNLEATKQLAVVSAMNLVQGGAKAQAAPARA